MMTLISHSWRSWKREKGVAALAILALSIGIGCATALFTAIDAALLSPLPYADGDRWVLMTSADLKDTNPDHSSGMTMYDLHAYQQRMRSFEVFGWLKVYGSYNLTAPGRPEHVDGVEVSPSLIAYTGIQPTAGRFFTAQDGPAVAVISHRLMTKLGRGIVGRLIHLDGEPYTVVGVTPSQFRLPLFQLDYQNSKNDVWIPSKRVQDEANYRGNGSYVAYGKLRRSISLAQAKDEVRRLAVQVGKENHQETPNYTARIVGLQGLMVKTIRPILLLLFGAACLLLLITCANVAGLLIGRSIGRARETAVRVALGGGRKQLALQYFSESLVISLSAMFGSMLVNVLLLHFIQLLAAEYIPHSERLSANWTSAGFALGLAFLTAALSALAPLSQALSTEPNAILTSGIRASASLRSRRFSQTLVGAEIALAFTLLSASGMLIWYFQTLNTKWPGFQADHLLTFELTNADNRMTNNNLLSVRGDRLVNELKTIPGVNNATATNQLPLAGCCMGSSIYPESRLPSQDRFVGVSVMTVSPTYLQTMGLHTLDGRFLDAGDRGKNPALTVIDEAVLKKLWPGQKAVGKFVHFGGPQGERMQIVGVVNTVRNRGMLENPMPSMYVVEATSFGSSDLYFAVRSHLPAALLSPAIRAAVARVDPSQPIYQVHTMREIIGESLIFQRIQWVVIAVFATGALLMAGLGVYGITSYSVRQRTAEMGMRMALGATSTDLLKLIIGSGIRLAVYGMLFGSFFVAAATWAIQRYLDVKDVSPAVYLYSVVIVISVALLSSFVPAWRASMLSPMVAIRNETDSIWLSARRSLQRAFRSEKTEIATVGDASLLSEFIEASRRAGSFSEVLATSLHAFRLKIRSESVMLLEKVAAGEYRCLASSPAGETSILKIPDDGYLMNRLRFFTAPLPIAEGDLETALRWDEEQKRGNTEELQVLKGLGVRLAIPLRTKKDVLGLLLFGEATDGRGYSHVDNKLLDACAAQFALTLENARLNDRVLQQDRVRRDLELAIEVQRRLLPEKPPQTTGSSLDAYTLAARSVGGDYYDFLDVGERRIGIALADVAGKGIAAALIMAVVQASLRIIVSEGGVLLPELAARLNRYLHRSTGAHSYATFFYAQVDEEKRQLRYVNAGHNPPYLVRGPREGANIEELSTGGTIVGMFPAASYEEAVVELQTGDVLLAFTDGVTEALNNAEEEFGEDRLKELLQSVAHLAVREITAAISEQLRKWIGTADQYDDLTFIVLKVNEPGSDI